MSNHTYDSTVQLIISQLPSTDPTEFPAIFQDLKDIIDSLEHLATHVSRPIVSKTANYTLTIKDRVVILDATSNAVRITLHEAAASEGKSYTFKCINATNTADLLPAGVETIDGTGGALALVLNQSIVLISDGANWLIIG